MLATIGTPHLVMPPPIQTVAIAAGASPSVVNNQLPFQSVASSYSASAAYNNMRGNAYAPLQANASVSQAISQSASRGSALSSQVTFGFSTPFMAQLIAQGGSNDNVVQSFIRSLPEGSATLDNETLETYSLIKYLPSNASAPAPKPQGVAQLGPTPIQQPEQIELRPVTVAVPQTTVPQASAVQTSTPQASMSAVDTLRFAQRVSGYGGYLPAAPSSERSLPRDASGTEPIRVKASLIRPQGVDAYRATSSRNDENLTPVTPVPAADESAAKATSL